MDCAVKSKFSRGKGLIMYEEDGVYRWTYEFPLLKNPVILFVIWKIFGGILIGLWVFLILISLKNSGFWWRGFLELTKVLGFLSVGLAVLSLLGYLIYSLIMGGKYCVLFEMDEKGLSHIQISKQFRKAKGMAGVISLVGIASGNMTTAGSGILAGTKSSLYSRWSVVKSIVICPRRNLIKLNSLFSKNQVYVRDEDFEFVKNYILSHCKGSKVLEK